MMPEQSIFPAIICRKHGNSCPKCGRYLIEEITECLCGQTLIWEDHYNEFCTGYEPRCAVIVTGGRRTCNNCGFKILKDTPIVEVRNGRMARTNICLACMEKLTSMVHNRM